MYNGKQVCESLESMDQCDSNLGNYYSNASFTSGQPRCVIEKVWN